MYRLRIATVKAFVKPYLLNLSLDLHVSSKDLDIVIGKRYSEFVEKDERDLAKIGQYLRMYGSIAQYLGIWDETYSMPVYTRSLIPLWKAGRITRSRIDTDTIDEHELTELFQFNSKGRLPGMNMIEQILLTQSEVPLCFIFQIGAFITCQQLDSFRIQPLTSIDTSMYKYIQGLTIPNLGGPQIRWNLHYNQERKYLPGSPIPYVDRSINYYPQLKSFNLEAAKKVFDHIATNSRYSQILQELQSA